MEDLFLNEKPVKKLNDVMERTVKMHVNNFVFPYNKYENLNNELDHLIMALIFVKMGWASENYRLLRVRHWKAIEYCAAQHIMSHRHYATRQVKKCGKGKYFR
jgi:hypothetical protein